MVMHIFGKNNVPQNKFNIFVTELCDPFANILLTKLCLPVNFDISC